MCITVKALALIQHVSVMCPGATVNKRAICTVTLTLVNCENNSFYDDVEKPANSNTEMCVFAWRHLLLFQVLHTQDS